MYISKIEIENFQCHKHFEYDLSPQINAIVGPSDRGKTAIIRAIKWCLYNKPKGTQIRRNSGTQNKPKYNRSRVKLYFSNGNAIERIRDNKDNQYIVYYADGTLKKFDNFSRTGIPQDVTDAHGISPVIYNGQELYLSIAGQHDTPFLIGDSPLNRTRIFGAATGLDIRDIAVTKANSDINNLSKKIKSLTSDSDKKEVRITELKEEEKLLSSIYDRADVLYKESGDIEEYIDKLNIIKNKLDAVNDKIDLYRKELSGLNDIDEKNIADIENVYSEITNLKILLNKVDTNNQSILSINTILSRHYDVTQVDKYIEDALTSYNTLQSLIILSEKTSWWVENFTKCKAGISNADIDCNSVEAIIKNELSQLKVCPFCGDIMTEDKINRIIKE